MKDAIQRAQYEHELRELHKYARPYLRPYDSYSTNLKVSTRPPYSPNYLQEYGSYHKSDDKLTSPANQDPKSPIQNDRNSLYSCQCQSCCYGSSSSNQ